MLKEIVFRVSPSFFFFCSFPNSNWNVLISLQFFPRFSSLRSLPLSFALSFFFFNFFRSSPFVKSIFARNVTNGDGKCSVCVVLFFLFFLFVSFTVMAPLNLCNLNMVKARANSLGKIVITLLKRIVNRSASQRANQIYPKRTPSCTWYERHKLICTKWKTIITSLSVSRYLQ